MIACGSTAAQYFINLTFTKAPFSGRLTIGPV